MDGDVFRRDAERLGHEIMRRLRALDASPDLHLAVGDARCGRRRLHRRMRQMRDVIFGLDLFGGAGHGRGGVAFMALDRAGLARRRLEFGAIGFRIIGSVRPVVPFDLQGVAALDGRPGVVGDDRQPARGQEAGGERRRRDLDDLHHAGDFHRLG